MKKGRITEQRVEESGRKILAAKYDLELVDQRLTPVDKDSIDGSTVRMCGNWRLRSQNMRSR